MSHQPFETWIFSDESLDEAQQHLLAEHLESCQPCSTLSEGLEMAASAISNSELLSPQPGLSQRWHNRLALHRQHQKTRTAWILTLAGIIVANIILLCVVFFDLTTINWAYEISQIIVKLSLIATHTRHYWRAIYNLANAFPGITTTFILIVAALTAGSIFLAITWISSKNKSIKTN